MTLISNALSTFTESTSRAALQDHEYKRIKPELKRISRVNPYATSPENAELLETFGIGSLPSSISLHSHGPCKAIENHMLSLLGSQLPREPVSHLFIKPHKLQLMNRPGLDTSDYETWVQHVSSHYRRGCNNIPGGDWIFNAHIEPKDVSRYPFGTTHTVLPSIPTRFATMVDTMMFLQPSDLLTLLSGPTCHTLYYTVVLPPEALYKHRPLYPTLYNITYADQGFHFSPNGHDGGSYYHRYEQLAWLKLGYITDGVHYVTLQKIETLGAHHLFVACRGKMLTPEHRLFANTNLVSLPTLFAPSEKNLARPIPYALYNRLFLYAKSVKQVTERDLFAKIRQLLPNKMVDMFHPNEIIHIVNYFSVIVALSSTNDGDKLFTCSLWEEVVAPFRARFQQWVKRLTGETPFEALLRLTDVEPFTYSWNTETAHVSGITIPTIKDVIVEKPLEQALTSELLDLSDQPLSLPASPLLLATTLPSLPSSPGSFHSAVENIQANPPEHATQESDEQEPLPEIDDNSAIRLFEHWVPLLNAHGFTDFRTQYDPNGVEILPISRVQQPPVEPVTPPIDPDLAAILLSRRRHFYPVPFLKRRAHAYSSDIKRGAIGLLLKQRPTDVRETWNALCKNADTTNVPTCVIHGAGGSGKSQSIQEWMNEKPRDITIIVPTKKLKQDWDSKLNPAWYPIDTVKTFETAIMQACSDTVVFDDYGKIPAGFIEFFYFVKSNCTAVILTGDYRQSVHHEENQEAETRSLLAAIDYFDTYCSYYLNITHRNVQPLANALSVYSTNYAPLTVSKGFCPPSEGVVLVPDSETAKYYDSGSGRCGYTYAGCQGITAKAVHIVLNRYTEIQQPRQMYTALSRAIDEVHFVCTVQRTYAAWDKFRATPFLSTFLNLCNDDGQPAEIEPIAPEEPTEPEPPRTHLPVDPASAITETSLDDMPDRFDREIYIGGEHTSCIREGVAPIVEAVQHQTNKDDAFFAATVDSRLSFSTPENNMVDFFENFECGLELWDAYAKRMRLPRDTIPFEADLWEECANEVQNTYLKKDIRGLMNGMLRQDPDFQNWFNDKKNKEKIAGFIKTQPKWKEDSMGKISSNGGKVKAGQTIASFFQSTVMVYGQMARYMRRMRERYQPDNILINCEKNPEQINDFVLKHWNFKRTGYANDYEEYDKRQDGAVLQFEVAKAQHHAIPEHVIQGYIFVKTHAEVYAKVLEIIRLSGEGPTFDANTEMNIAYDSLKFDIPDDCAAMYGGDDLLRDAECPIRAESVGILKRIKLKSKPERFTQTCGDYGKFCSWTVTPLGIIKNPALFYERLQYGLKKNMIHNLLPSYRLDIYYTYKHGDAIYDILNEQDQRYHFSSLRLLIKHGYNPGQYNLPSHSCPPPLCADPDNDDTLPTPTWNNTVYQKWSNKEKFIAGTVIPKELLRTTMMAASAFMRLGKQQRALTLINKAVKEYLPSLVLPHDPLLCLKLLKFLLNHTL